MKTHVLRLLPKQDLKKELLKFTKDNKIKAGFIITCVGSLKKATLRLSNLSVKDFDNQFEITSLVGTLSQDGLHLHISLSDEDGFAVGGHVKEGCEIHTTAEIAIGELEDQTFVREKDESTGFKELKTIKEV